MNKSKYVKGYNDRYTHLGLAKIEELLKNHKVPIDLKIEDVYARADVMVKEINKNLPNNTKQFKRGQLLEHISWNEYGFYKWNALKALLMSREKLREQREKEKNKNFAKNYGKQVNKISEAIHGV